MPSLGLPELIIILVIVIIVFGAGRLGEIGGALGRGISEFRKSSDGSAGNEEAKKPAETEKKA